MVGREKKNLMKVSFTVLLFAAFCFCAGFALWDRIVVHVRGPAVTHGIAASAPAGAASILDYPAETIGLGETGTHVHRFIQKAEYTFAAFGGELLGADRGEWGGELVFRDASGTVHPVLQRNVHGIVRMPFGVVVFTGLAHMGQSAGGIFRIEKRNDGAVAATRMHSLRGAPGDVRWTTSGDLVFSVHYVSRDGLFDGVHVQCLLLDRSGDLRRRPCLMIVGG